MEQKSQAFEERYKKLNKAQKKAVDTIEGPLLVVAGPGSGKTEILSLRVAKILKEAQIRASNILCLTFTESASLNMRDRLSRLIGQEAYHVSIHTFHNFCVDIIGRYPEYFYKGAIFSPADTIAQIEILEEIFRELPHDHPFSSEHPDQGFVYLKPVLSAISHLKKAGLKPDEFRKIIDQNEKELNVINDVLVKVFEERISKKVFPKVDEAINELNKISKKDKINLNDLVEGISFKSITETYITSLTDTLKRSIETEDTKILSAWKEKRLKKTDEGGLILKDINSLEKVKALADMYKQYSSEMYSRGFFDFDDMILDVITSVSNHPDLKFDLQEQYQYILVDEFQDTNDAQMRLIRLLASASVNEGRPNIMAVGDDDQAIYKFQGAELSNILDFRRNYNDVEIVTLTSNYRSTQDILDIASHLIRKGEQRLEYIVPEIEKNLVASNKELDDGNILNKKFPTNAHQYHYISRQIKKLIDSGYNPAEIAVISRKHKELEALVPYMQGAGVPIKYEREQNVFLEPHIEQLIIISRFINSLVGKNTDEADELLPQILSFPFWNLSRKKIWEISLAARRGQDNEVNWLEVMSRSDDKEIKQIAEFFVDLGVSALHEPLEKILDRVIGAHVPLSRENEDDDSEFIDGEEGKLKKNEEEFSSPFKSFYFSKEKFDHSRAEYLSFLSSLRVFINAIREFRSGKIITIKDLVDFVEIHEKNNISLNDKSPFANAKDSVNLLTAHKSKGLEFETVFVMSCQDDIWAGKNRGTKLSFPINLPIEPAGDNFDDQLRLFYVALTRAKKNLYLTSYSSQEDGEESPKLRFLISGENADQVLENKILEKIYFSDEDDTDIPETSDVLTASWLNYHTPPFFGEEKVLLKGLLENYQLSVTHLNNFLNVSKGGPQFFLEQNLLRFPQSKSPSGSFGSAIHSALERISITVKDKKLNVDEAKNIAIDWFEKYLRRERISAQDFTKFSEKGRKALNIFLSEKLGEFKVTDKTEVSFKDQGVIVGGAHLNGKIDRMSFENDSADGGSVTSGNLVTVHDYKTGKVYEKWQGKNEYEKIKIEEYKRQLAFYKLLVENSKLFGDRYKVNKGVLEFVEPVEVGSKGTDFRLVELPLEIDKELADRTARLVEIVYKKILNIDFPDVTKYSQDIDGITAFEEDLLAEKI